jgi:hypothetical protein
MGSLAASVAKHNEGQAGTLTLNQTAGTMPSKAAG